MHTKTSVVKAAVSKAARGNAARDRLAALHFLIDLSNLALLLLSYYTTYIYYKTMESNI